LCNPAHIGESEMKGLEKIIVLLAEIEKEIQDLNKSRDAFWARVKEDQDRDEYREEMKACQHEIDLSDPYQEYGVKRSDFQ
jgi:hypothetical protein